ncbi:hypothetical protein [Shewanella livingstonensis]|uniref:Lipoprotein n=1 Tax=Shewanella livingstonensis TaxID=150120 RepID=A0A3G8LZ70_9GAMM|nr:hypothetical protein [Shewanella livingstonensis]AZG75043.1 hypothetical protein EGC82_21150 [Shewanella livingstonensis]
MKKLIAQLTLLSALVILSACSATRPTSIGNSGNADDNRNDNDYMLINLPIAILASDPCKYGHPDDIAACRKKKQDETNQLNESFKRQ